MYAPGPMMHAGASTVFAFAQAGVLVAADIDSEFAAWALLFGAVQWAISGLALGTVP